MGSIIEDTTQYVAVPQGISHLQVSTHSCTTSSG